MEMHRLLIQPCCKINAGGAGVYGGQGIAGALKPLNLIFIYVKEPQEAGGRGKAHGLQLVSPRPWAPGQDYAGAGSGQLCAGWADGWKLGIWGDGWRGGDTQMSCSN